MPLVSIIIPVFNQSAMSRMCLARLVALRPSDPEREIIVVDNGSTDETQQLLQTVAAHEPSLRVVRFEKNQGFSKGCNAGARAAAGDYLCFLNNDTDPQPGWLAALCEVLDRDSDVAAAGSRLLFPDGRLQHAGVMIADVEGTDPLFAFHPFEGQRGDHPVALQSRTYQALTAACVLVRRGAFEAAGGFDEGYWNGYEDVDLCFKLRAAGGLLVYEPRSVVVHHTSRSGPERWSKKRENIHRLHERWIGRVQPDLLVAPSGAAQDNGAGVVKPYAAPVHSR